MSLSLIHIFRDVGRVMNLTYAETDAVAKQIPATPHMTLDEALRISPQLRTMVEMCIRDSCRICGSPFFMRRVLGLAADGRLWYTIMK